MSKYCKVCSRLIPERRVQLGYPDTCVDHSSTFRYVGFVASDSKVDYDISIVRDNETAEHMQRLFQSRGAF